MTNPLEQHKHLFEMELEEVNKLIIAETNLDTELIPQLTKHLVENGGKRLRPILTILCAKLFGHNGTRHIALATAVEFLHTATLLHDDVVDESDLRRGVSTANNVWGNSASILVGDFLLSKSFQLMSNDGDIEVLKTLSNASAKITEGEVQQLTAKSDIGLSEGQYIQIITAKTATLFAAACVVGAVICEQSDAEKQAIYDYGLNLGIAFQIADDALDYSSNAAKVGKIVGDDFREQKVTIPVLLAKNDEPEFWQRTIEGEQKDGDLERAIEIIEAGGYISKSLDMADIYRDKAIKCLSPLPDCEIRELLFQLANFAVRRSN